MRETKFRRSFTLDLEPEAAEGACRQVLAELEWKLDNEDGGTLSAAEPVWRLGCCRDMPARVELSVSPDDGGGSTVTIDGSMRGRGLIQRKLLPGRLGFLASLITTEAARTCPPGPGLGQLREPA